MSFKERFLAIKTVQLELILQSFKNCESVNSAEAIFLTRLTFYMLKHV